MPTFLSERLASSLCEVWIYERELEQPAIRHDDCQQHWRQDQELGVRQAGQHSSRSYGF